MIKISLEAFLISLVREHSKKDSTSKTVAYHGSNIYAVHQYITENFNTKISLDNLCFLFGYNKTTLCQSFKNEFGDTILNYINTLRIKESKALLRAQKMTVTEISEKVGFDSVHYFCRHFKKHIGLSPTEYIKSIRSKLDIKEFLGANAFKDIHSIMWISIPGRM